MSLRESITLVTKWCQTWRSLPVIPWVKGAIWYRRGRFDRAAAFYRSGLVRHLHHPARAYAFLDLAQCLFKTGDLIGAESALRDGISEKPDFREGQLRLIRLLLFMGRVGEAAQAAQRALRHLPDDTEVTNLFLLAALDEDAPRHYELRARETVEKEEGNFPVARALVHFREGELEESYQLVAPLLERDDSDAMLLGAMIELEYRRVAHARRLLHRLLEHSPNHPRVLGLLARTYLAETPLQNIEYAQQLALEACRASAWRSPREMQLLAEIFQRHGDKVSALLMASRALDASSTQLRAHRGTKQLAELVANLSSGTLS